MVNTTTMRVLDDALLPATGLVTMHMVMASEVSEQARLEVKRCMKRVVEHITAN